MKIWYFTGWNIMIMFNDLLQCKVGENWVTDKYSTFTSVACQHPIIHTNEFSGTCFFTKVFLILISLHSSIFILYFCTLYFLFLYLRLNDRHIFCFHFCGVPPSNYPHQLLPFARTNIWSNKHFTGNANIRHVSVWEISEILIFQ